MDLSKWHSACSVARNMVVSYKGGLFSRAGMPFVGPCKQQASASSTPPRIIEFTFSTSQSYILEFGDKYMRVVANGAYVTETPIPLIGASQANPCVLNIPGNNFAAGDYIFVAGVAGMLQIDNEFFIVLSVSGNFVTVSDLFGEAVNSIAFSAYAGGGTAARVYTLATPYAAADLPFLKFTQSADVMSLTCVNDLTQTEYPPQDLERIAANNWAIAPPNFASSIAAPASCSAAASTAWASGDAGPAAYGYVVTAIDATTGEESVASSIGVVVGSVDIAAQFGTITVSWPAVANAGSYNIYRTTPDYTNVGDFAGQLFGYSGSTVGATTWQDTNIIPDFDTSPPLHINPFAVGQIIEISMTSGGSGYSQSTVGYTLTTAAGTGASLLPVVQGGAIVAVIIENPGQKFQSGDTINFTGGTGAAAALTIGPESGNYPGVVHYFQQRRGYADSLNAPDTYEFSQPGTYLNFDSASPPIDSDSITGTPWATQVNGIQFMLPMPGGDVIFTGNGAWQLSGTGGTGSPITPSQQSAQPQEAIGSSAILPPIKIDYDILFGQSIGSEIRDLQYNFYFNIYAGSDTTLLSSHLFQGFTIQQWAFAREPYKVVWCVRNDGKVLSLTFIKDQEIKGWTRHDTNGLVASVATAVEPPVNAVYFIVKRYIVGKQKWVYYLERMDNRLWQNIEQCCCVDAGLSLPQPAPAATLTASQGNLPGNLGPYNIVLGGSGYTNPSGVIIDPTGTNGVVSFTVVGGVITAISVSGSGFTAPQLAISDNTGSGALIALGLDQSITFTAASPVFAPSSVGSVIRMGGGIAAVSSFLSSTEVIAQLTAPITATMPNDPNAMPIPAQAGSWTMTAPVTTVSGINHLEGMEVAILADGSVVPNQIVTNGQITLPSPASQITLGLPFTPQMQGMHADVPGAMVQGKRKRIQGVTLRMANSRGVKIGQDQPIAAATQNQAETPWNQAPNYLTEIEDRTNSIDAGNAIPLFTGDRYVPIVGDYSTTDGQPSPGMVAMQQDYPLPVEILAFIPELQVADSNG
jgi:hypothetical protein